jgi:iron complex outermembrane recepter protein
MVPAAKLYLFRPGVRKQNPSRGSVDSIAKVFAVAIFATLTALVLLGLGPEGWADDSTQTQSSGKLTHLSLAQLGSLEVTSVSKLPEEVRRTPAAVFVLTQDDIRRSGATSIPELLRLVPGVEVARRDSNHWSVGIRGFGSQFSRSVLVMIDGRSVYTPLFAGVFWDVQNTPLDDIDRIEVIRGPGGTIWGANAVNGIINIITKQAKDTHGTLATAGGGSLDQGTAGVRYGAGNGRNLDYRIYGQGWVRGAESHSDGHEYDDGHVAQAGFRTDWSRPGRDSLTVQGDLYQGQSGEKVGVGSFIPPAQLVLEGNDFVSGGNLLTRWRREFSGRSGIQLQVYYDRTKRLAPHFGETRDTVDIDFLNHLQLWGRHNLLWGFGARVSPNTFLQKVPTLDFAPHNTDSVYSGFVQDEIQIVEDRLSVTVGTKLERNNYSGVEAQPSVRLLWTPSDKQTFWTAFTRAVRTPSRLDVDLDLKGFLLPAPPLPIYLKIAGNPNFESETLLGTEAGYRSLLSPKLYLDVDWFHNEYDKLSSLGASQITVQTVPITYILLTFPYENGVRGSTDGFEIAPNWQPTNWWQLKGSYSFLHFDLGLRPGAVDTSAVSSYINSSPHHQVVVQSQVNLPRGLEFDQTYRYVSALPGQAVSDYSTADVRLGWRPVRQLELSLVGQNLLQPFHMEFGSDPGPIVGIKRDIYAKLTWSSTSR